MRYLSVYQAEIYEVNKENGWFDKDRTFGEDIALLHSECSEALEEYRVAETEDRTTELCIDKVHKQYMGHIREYAEAVHRDMLAEDEHICKPEGVGPEFADILVRLLDSCQRYNIDLDFEMERKIAYNRTRGYRHGNRNL